MPQKFALENRQLVLMEMGLKMPSGRFDDESFRSSRTLGQFEDMGATLGRTLDRIMSHPLGCCQCRGQSFILNKSRSYQADHKGSFSGRRDGPFRRDG